MIIHRTVGQTPVELTSNVSNRGPRIYQHTHAPQTLFLAQKNIPAPFSHGKFDLFLKEHILLKANYDPSASVAILNLESQVLTVSTIQTKPNYQLSLDLLCLELPDNETTCQCQ